MKDIKTYHDFCNFLKWLDYGYTKRSIEATDIIINNFEVSNFADDMKEEDKVILCDLFLRN